MADSSNLGLPLFGVVLLVELRWWFQVSCTGRLKTVDWVHWDLVLVAVKLEIPEAKVLPSLGGVCSTLPANWTEKSVVKSVVSGLCNGSHCPGGKSSGGCGRS